jgi:hypothetical protein
VRKFLRGFIAFSLVLTSINTLFAASASAQTTTTEPDERITLSPAVVRPDFDAGQRGDGKITIINDGNTDYTFLLYARPFSVNGESYDPNYTEVNDRTEAYQWVQFKRTEFKLAAGQRVEADYSIQVPKSAASGGHYAVIFAETQPPQGNDNVARKKRVGALVYMTVRGTIDQEGALLSWNTNLWQKKAPLVSQVRVRNTGNVHFQADLTASYSNLFGKKQFTLNQQLLVLPGTTRRIPVQWDKPPAFGIFKVGGSISYLGKTDKLDAKYIVLLPIKYLLITLAVILVAVVTYFTYKKRIKRRIKSGRRR